MFSPTGSYILDSYYMWVFTFPLPEDHLLLIKSPGDAVLPGFFASM